MYRIVQKKIPSVYKRTYDISQVINNVESGIILKNIEILWGNNITVLHYIRINSDYFKS